MSIFQHSIVKKNLNTLDKALVSERWAIFKAHFLNLDIQENIRNSKEEQYQEGFLRDLFVSVLGYKLNPSAGFNITTEYKNIKDSKKADGAIIISGHVKAVIELKGNDTTDLDKIEPQAFGYKNNQPECKYIIISNFEKLRFYIDNAVDKIEFNLFKLTEEEFSLLWLCLSYQSIESDVPLNIKNASVDNEENITKELYKDYSLFKRELYQNLVQLNPQYNELELFRKSQKLLDRFLFIFFAEDRELLPENSIRKILEQWNQLRELDAYDPLYNRYKKYFGYMNTGHKGKESDIFAYNGGLFKPDDILDNVLIDDELLYKHTMKLSSYDFASDVDVNILGHIFENSLNEIDEVKAQLEGQQIDKTQSKRKKDGVFYTPKYITKYIVENTVGKLCSEKKTELRIDEQEYTSEKKKNKDTKQKLLAKLTDYRNWLLHITIVDPACGSGAFLNEALNFLIDEHTYIDELETKITGGSIVFPNIENSILENNLYGVDLNEESVEIAKLSLWLRTAKPNRKLNDLSNNIKCGNSLIDDPEVAGEKAFHWQKEFPHVFAPKQKKIWHVTTATHNSRYSQRMFDNHVKLSEAEWIDTADELIITQTVAEIAKADALNILQYNLCGDHLHLLIACEEEELPGIVKIIKGRTARARNLNKGINPLVRQNGENSSSLWTQKYGCTEVDNEEYLRNAIEYIRTNRVKHKLPANAEMEKIIKTFLCTVQHALRTEYKGGFDVVIGNPPYVNAIELKKKSSEKEYNYLKNNYGTAKGTVDLYIYFFEKGLKIINSKGILSYITPNRFLSASYGSALREFLIFNYKIERLIDYSDKNVFDDASTYPVITFLSKKVSSSYEIITGKFDATRELKAKSFPSSKLTILDDYILGFLLNDKLEITEKIIFESLPLSSCGKINATSTAKEADDISDIINEVGGLKLINTGTIDPYSTTWGFEYLTDKGSKYLKPFLPLNNSTVSKNRYNLYNSQKIIISKIGLKCEAFYDKEGSFASINTNCIHSFENEFLPEYILCWLNSKLYNYMFECLFDGLRMSGGYLLFSAPNLKNTYIKKATLDLQQPFIEKADLMLELNKELQEVSGKFQRNAMREFNLQVLSGKLQSWFELPYSDFLKELAKAKVSLTLPQKAEWEAYFIAEQQKATALQNRIHTTDKEIDAMVYQLYGLTDEEIKIVEGEGS